MFDLTKQDETERDQRAFDEGAADGESGGFMDDVSQEFDEIFHTVNPLQDSEHESYDAGYREGQRRR